MPDPLWLAGLVTLSLRRSIPRVAVVLAIPTIPALAFTAFGWGSAIGVWMLGALTGIISTLSSSARTALPAIAALSVAAGLGVANNGNPWGAMLIMGTVAGLSGLVSARGLQSAVSMVPIGAAFIVTQPPVVMMNASAEGNATAVALLIACSAGWGMLVTWTVMRKIHFPAVDPTPPGHARILAIMLTIVVGGAAWFVAHLDLGHGGAWLLMTIIIVIRPGIRITFITGTQRALGTIVGFVIVIALSTIVNQPITMLVVGAVLVGVSLLIRLNPLRAYWEFVLVMTPGVVLLVGAGSDEGSLHEVAVSRLCFTLIGSALGPIAMGLLIPFTGRSAHAGPVSHADATHG